MVPNNRNLSLKRVSQTFLSLETGIFLSLITPPGGNWNRIVDIFCDISNQNMYYLVDDGEEGGVIAVIKKPR
jgi:hypothetical protein